MTSCNMSYVVVHVRLYITTFGKMNLCATFTAFYQIVFQVFHVDQNVDPQSDTTIPLQMQKIKYTIYTYVFTLLDVEANCTLLKGFTLFSPHRFRVLWSQTLPCPVLAQAQSFWGQCCMKTVKHVVFTPLEAAKSNQLKFRLLLPKAY